MIFDFEIEGKKHTLYFGMVATQIVAEKSVNVAYLNPKDPDVQIKTFAYIVYGGLCNQADRKDFMRPNFEEAYDLTVSILEQGEELQTNIWNAWSESKPAKAMLAALPKPVTEEGKKKGVTKSRTGTK